MNINTDWDSNSVKHYKSVDHIKKRMRKGNWNYLCRHPEIRAIIRVFLSEAINEQPGNIYDFAAKLFDCNNSSLLIPMINHHLKSVNMHLKNCRFGGADGEKFFMRRESTHSLASKESVGCDINNILTYALVLQK